MSKLFVMLLAFAAIFGFATDAFAATEFNDAVMGFGAVFGMGLAAAGCGIAQGMGLKGACEGVARNPDASGKITTVLILGLAFVESLAIYTLAVNLIIFFVQPFGG